MSTRVVVWPTGWAACLFLSGAVCCRLPAEETAVAKDSPSPVSADVSTSTETAGFVRLSKKDACWIDPKHKQVIVDAEVCLREGYLEMFACTKGTKEHEAVVALHSKAYVVHAALLAVGAEVGHPAQFQPEYKPAAGTEIDVFVEWTVDGKKKRTRGQEWVRQVATKKPMTHSWVFAGSSFWKDPADGKRYYRAESGDVICVSNFPTAMMDLPIESSQTNDDLLFEAFKENIPPRGTPVRVILAPKLKKVRADQEK